MLICFYSDIIIQRRYNVCIAQICLEAMLRVRVTWRSFLYPSAIGPPFHSRFKNLKRTDSKEILCGGNSYSDQTRVYVEAEKFSLQTKETTGSTGVWKSTYV